MPGNIAITGLGCVSSCGGDVLETLENFSRGISDAGPVSLFKTDLNCPVFEVKKNLAQDNSKMRTLSLALQATQEAVRDAGLRDLTNLRVGVCLGTTVASQLNDIDFYRAFREKGSAPLDSVERFLKGNLALRVGEFLGVRMQLCVTVVNACSSGTDAIGVGLSWLRNDYCDIVIAGGADELNRVPYTGFHSLGVMSQDLCAPFDRERSGLNLGEGAGIVVLEQEEVARKRGKAVGLFLQGYGLAADAYHLTAPRPDGSGLEDALLRALNEAGVSAGEIAFINAHGTATRDNDKVEGAALLRIFGPKIKFLSTKGFTGHALGAAGGLEAVFTCLGLCHGWIPACAGFKTLDEEIGIAPVNQKTEIKGGYAISTSLAFGGNNSALVIARS